MRDSTWIGCLGGWLAVGCTAPEPPEALEPRGAEHARVDLQIGCATRIR